MKIIDCCLANLEYLEKYAGMYNDQVNTAAIKPTIAYSRFDPREFLSVRNKGFVVASSDGNVRGILDYVLKGGEIELYDMEGWQFDRMGFESHPPGFVAEIEMLESFPPGKGTGRKLVEALKDKTGIVGIVVKSKKDAISFYQCMGFDFPSEDYGPDNSWMKWDSRW
jgi:hypothetical protein